MNRRTPRADRPVSTGASPMGLRMIQPLRDFLSAESAGGVLLVAAALIAMLWANSPWSEGYQSLWHTPVHLGVGNASLHLDLRQVVGDGLMTLFFLVVGLEIKREVVEGELRGLQRAALPVVAAVGGMVVPAVWHLLVTHGTTGARGWGIPMATDIALAIGVVGLIGSRVPRGAVLFLLALAIVDDIGAIVVIAVSYSGGVAWWWLAGAAAVIASVSGLRKIGVVRVGPYVVLGAALWLCLHEAGVHPTLAGVVMGLLAPTRPLLREDLVDEEVLAAVLVDVSSVERARETVEAARSSVSVVEWLVHVLHPWTSRVVVPLFALANAGVPLGLSSLRASWGSSTAWGVALGLVVGKPVGIVAAVAVARRLGVGSIPDGVTMRQVASVGVIAGIGFTVSMFVTALAFAPGSVEADQARVGILFASTVCALAGAAALSATTRSPSRGPR